MLGDDDISLSEHQADHALYQDELTDEDDIFASGDGDEEQGLGEPAKGRNYT